MPRRRVAPAAQAVDVLEQIQELLRRSQADGSREAKPRKSARKSLPTYAKDHETVALLAAARCERDRVMLLCLRNLGVRVAELVALAVEDLQRDGTGRITTAFVRLGKGARDRYVPVPADLAGPLAAWVTSSERPRSPWLFPSPENARRHLTTRSVQHLVAMCSKRAGVRHLTPHKFRHACATYKLRAGADVRHVQEWLGHASLATTQIYTHVDPEDLQRLADHGSLGAAHGHRDGE